MASHCTPVANVTDSTDFLFWPQRETFSFQLHVSDADL